MPSPSANIAAGKHHCKDQCGGGGGEKVRSTWKGGEGPLVSTSLTHERNKGGQIWITLEVPPGIESRERLTVEHRFQEGGGGGIPHMHRVRPAEICI